MKLWGRRSAFNVQKALWALGELGLPFEHVEVGGPAGGLDTPDFLALNPHGRIPVLEDGERVVWESHAIVRYLAAGHGEGSLWPPSPARRAPMPIVGWTGRKPPYSPTSCASSGATTARPKTTATPPGLERAGRACARHFAQLEAHLARQPYLAGDDFTMGDIPAGTALHRYFEMGWPTPALPKVQAWRARLEERAAYREHVAVPFDELKGRTTF